jgi:hypothetical protein|tara:strand:+ start:688 stop:1449 length:762 start_codon:yes stop_codon:yes gene_type:complete
MMFIEAKLQLSSIKFDGKKKKIDVTELGKLFDSKCLDEMDVPPPPANDSDTTLKEIKDMVNNRNTLSPFKKKAYELTDQDPAYFIKDYMDDYGLVYNEKTIKDLMQSVKHVGRHFKNKFERPRPRQIAEALELNLRPFITDTTASPSYPSNHSIQGQVVGLYYAKQYPDHAEGIISNARISGQGRIDAGVHYPSDDAASLKIAEEVMKKYFKGDIEEDAPMNATGAAVSTHEPIVRKKKNDKTILGLLKRNAL